MWVVDQIFLGGKQYLVDPDTGTVMSTDTPWPLPVGRYRDGRLALEWKPVQHEFFERLNGYMAKSGASLRDVFNAVDADRSGHIDPGELKALLEQLMGGGVGMMPEAIMLMLDMDGDQKITFQELVEGLRDILRSRDQAQAAQGPASAALSKIAAFVDGNRETARDVFMELDQSGNGQVTLTEALRAILGVLSRSGQALDRQERIALVNLLLVWDADGSGSLSFPEFCRAVGAARRVVRAPPELERIREEHARAEDAARQAEQRLREETSKHR